MKRTSILIYISVLSIVLSLTSCDKQIETPQPSPVKEEGVITLSSTYEELSSDKHEISIQVSHNCDYDIVIPESAQDWITIKETKAMIESSFVLSISKNENLYRRNASVIITNLTERIQDTLQIIQDEGYKSIRILLRDNPDVSIYYEALLATHLVDTIAQYEDLSYPSPAYDSTYTCLQQTGGCAVEYEIAYETGDSRQRAVWPDKRYFKYTLFVVPDSILKNVFGILSLEDLRDKAKEVYPEGAELPDENRNSSLNKYISYHILPMKLTWDQLNTSQPKIVSNRCFLDELDIEDFYEPLLQHSVMRVSSPYRVAFFQSSYLNQPDTEKERIGIFINRKGTIKMNNLIPGIEIHKTDSCILSDALNGCYYYIHEPLIYDNNTRTALNVRMRIMANTLSPDFINSGARGRMKTPNSKLPTDHAVYGFKKGFCKNVEWNDGSQFYVRYRDASFGFLYGDEMTIRGDYDITFKLPPVPNNEIYEIRFWGNSLGSSSQNDRGIVQFYFREGNNSEFIPCGFPVDLGVRSITEPQIGAVMDDQFQGTDEEIEQQMMANDKAMRNHGYMKAMDCYCTSSHSTKDAANSLRADRSCFRKIVGTFYMESDKDYYLRIRKTDDGSRLFQTFIINCNPYKKNCEPIGSQFFLLKI